MQHQHPQVIQQVVQEQPTQQYLLAIFAFFSVLNSPLASSSSRPTAHPHPQHTHHGHVLSETSIGPYAVPIMPPSASSTHTILGYPTPDLIQAFHLFVSTMVLFYIVMPWLSDMLKRHQSSSILSNLTSFFTRPHAHLPSTPTPAPPQITSQIAKPSAEEVQQIAPVIDTPEIQNLVEALAPCKRGTDDEAVVLRRCLGVSTGVLGLMQGVIKAARHDRGIELDQLEQRAWVRLGELVAFDGQFHPPSSV